MWKVATPASVILKDAAGNTVPTATLTCKAQDPAQAQVASDCSSITARRLGSITVTASAGSVSAPFVVTGVPQRVWTGTHGTGSSFGSGDYGFVVRPNGSLLAWGANPGGVLGQNKGYAALPSIPYPTPVLNASGTAPLSSVMQGGTGVQTSLALLQDGTVLAWGDNGNNALGRDGLGSSLLPLAVRDTANLSALNHAVHAEVGNQNGVALIDDGTVVAWGTWPGNGTTSSSSLPAQVVTPDGASVLNNIVAVSAGWSFSLALASDGRVFAWGFDLSGGRLGSGAVLANPTPRPFVVKKADGSDLTGIVQISAGYNFSLALADDGTVWAWGDNSTGQLGQGTMSNNSPVAVQVRAPSGSTGALRNITMVAAGGRHGLALDTTGQVFAWGSATNGQLGDGPNRLAGNEATLPRGVVSTSGAGTVSGVASIAAGYSYSTALMSNGDVLSWGYNFHSSLARGTSGSLDATPAPITSESGNGSLSLAPVLSYPNLLARAR